MALLFLLVVTLACLPENWQALAWGGLAQDPLQEIGLTWAGVALVVAGAARLARWTCRQLERHPLESEAILHRYRAWRFYHWLGLLAFYALALGLLGWGRVVQSLGPFDSDGNPQMFPGAELLVLAPFLAALLFSWACFYDADRARHDSGLAGSVQAFRSRWAYASFHVRHNLALVSVPVVLLVIEKGLRRIVADGPYEWVFQVVLLALMPAAFIGLPWALRLVLRLKPLPQSNLRERLLATSRRLNFRCSNILLWNTQGAMANAMVSGLVPGIRYVVLTDRLVSELTPDEVEAVFGHEIGHIKHRHMLFYLGFLLTSLYAVAGLWDLLASWVPLPMAFLREDQDLAAIPLLALLGGYIFVVFGFLSRRCERQADIFGCRAVSCAREDCVGHGPDSELMPGGKGLCPTGIRTFIDALEKVARINGISRNRPGWMQSWQHSTIARRVDFLQRVLMEPALEARFQRTVGLVKVVLLVGLGGVLLLLGMLPGGWERLRLF